MLKHHCFWVIISYYIKIYIYIYIYIHTYIYIYIHICIKHIPLLYPYQYIDHIQSFQKTRWSFIQKMVGAQVAKMVHETNTATSQMRQTVGEVHVRKCGISSIKKWDFEGKTFRKRCGKCFKNHGFRKIVYLNGWCSTFMLVSSSFP